MRVKADLHMHSFISDGRASPEELVHRALEAGLQVISVTDHDSFQGSVRARRYVEEKGLDLLVIIGNEVRTVKGDILVLCDHPIDPPVQVGELVDKAHEEGCIAVPAHPFDLMRQGIGKEVYNHRFDAIEVYNASADPITNRRARQAAAELGLPPLANTDAHIPEYLGTAYTLVETRNLSVEDFLEAVRRGKVQPVYGKPDLQTRLRRYWWSIERRIFR